MDLRHPDQGLASGLQVSPESVHHPSVSHVVNQAAEELGEDHHILGEGLKARHKEAFCGQVAWPYPPSLGPGVGHRPGEGEAKVGEEAVVIGGIGQATSNEAIVEAPLQYRLVQDDLGAVFMFDSAGKDEGHRIMIVLCAADQTYSFVPSE